MKEKLLLLSLLSLLASSCKTNLHAPPSFTICTVLATGMAYCTSNNLPSLENGKEQAIMPSDILLTPDNFKIFYNYGMDLRSKLINCENGK